KQEPALRQIKNRDHGEIATDDENGNPFQNGHAAGPTLEYSTHRVRNHPDRSLAESLLVRRDDRGNLVVRGGVVRSYDDDQFARLAYQPPAFFVQPPAHCIEYG